jgi:uncharacterized RDD family membrane protein YckC
MQTKQDNPFAPPGADVADVPVSGPELAGRGNRLLAAIVDVVIQVVVVFAVMALLGLSLWNANPSLTAQAVGFVVGLLAFLLIQGTLLVKHGQTWGKRLLGLRIVRPDGTRCSAGRILGLRYGVGFVAGMIPVLGMIYSLVDALLIFRASRQCLHDNIADTIVVKA